MVFKVVCWCNSKKFLKKNENMLHSFQIKCNICRAHTVTSNVTFHILFNEIFDDANIICMKMMWSILDVMHMRNITLHVIVNIIKFKRMHGLNYLSFGEQSQRSFFL